MMIREPGLFQIINLINASPGNGNRVTASFSFVLYVAKIFSEKAIACSKNVVKSFRMPYAGYFLNFSISQCALNHYFD